MFRTEVQRFDVPALGFVSQRAAVQQTGTAMNVVSQVEIQPIRDQSSHWPHLPALSQRTFCPSRTADKQQTVRLRKTT